MRFRHILLASAASLGLFFPFFGQAASPGDLIKGHASSSVYYAHTDGTRLAFVDGGVFFTWYTDFSAVKMISDAELAALPLGGVVTHRPGIKMVKIASDPKVYAVARGGELRWIQHEWLAAAIFGADWNRKILDVSDAMFVNYRVGLPISDRGQYWWFQEREAAPTISADVVLRTAMSTKLDTGTLPVPPPFAVSPGSVKNVLAILWDPHRPTDPAPPKTYVEDKIFGLTRSVADYYRVQSGGKVEIRRAGVFGWYDADKPADHYWNHPADANDGFASGHVEKWVEAIRKADAEFDYSTYDANHDGYLAPNELGILIIIPQEAPFGTNRPVVARELPAAEPLIVDGVVIYNISEVYMSGTTDFSVLAHEEGHLLFDLPDMYGAPMPAVRYSLMDVTYLDSQLDPYSKLWLGWLAARDVTADGYYDVYDVEKYREVLKIANPEDPNEFFLIENRQRGAYDTSLHDTGIVIWNVYDRREGDWGRENIRMIRPIGELSDYKAAWHGPGGPQGYDLSLTWRDGTGSGVTLKEFPASSASMRIYVDMP